jgi:peptidoglycan/LPS O-acetylase OafA/YrhL
VGRLREAFSLRRNWSLLITPQRGQQPALNGIRALTVLWVVALHTIMSRGLGEFPSDVYRAMYEDKNPILRFLLRGELAVDVFFALSGFLIGSILSKELLATGSLALGRFYWRRYLRLTPVYVVVVLLFCSNSLMPHRGVAWQNLLYINNFFPERDQFMPWTWSLAVEEQFYLTLPLVLIVLFRRPHVVMRGLVGLIVVGFAVRAGIVFAHGFHLPWARNIGDAQYDEIFDVLYDKPYTRYGCLLPGVVVAHARLTVPAERMANWFAATRRWLPPLVVLVMIATIYAPSGDTSVKWPPVVGFAYLVAYPYVFASCIAYFILYVLVEGRSGMLNRFLSWRGFYPAAQLSYATYLTHPPLAWVMYLAFHPGPARGLVDHLPYIAGVTGLSFLLSTLLYLFIERPIMNLR